MMNLPWRSAGKWIAFVLLVHSFVAAGLPAESMASVQNESTFDMETPPEHFLTVETFPVASYNPATGEWREWRLPGEAPQTYAVYVDERDDVWLSDFAANSLVRFDPDTETFASVPLPDPNANVRQIHGRPGEVWGAESGVDTLVVIRTECPE